MKEFQGNYNGVLGFRRVLIATKGMDNQPVPNIARRFRGYLPVIVDLETAGFDPRTHALLEIAAVPVVMDAGGYLHPGDTVACHVKPFEGAKLDPAALKFNGIDPDHPLRLALHEREALQKIFQPVRAAVREAGCTRAILVGHNPAFDIGFLNAAVSREAIKRNPFHPFSTFDTATLSGLAYGQTVLAKSVSASGLRWDNSEAHSAIYDAEMTARLFCGIVNRWRDLGGDALWQGDQALTDETKA